MTDNFVLPKTTSFFIIRDVSAFIVEKCPLLPKSPQSAMAQKIIAAYLFYTSWHAFWQPDIKSPLSELLLFVESKPAHPEWVEHLTAWSKVVHPSRIELDSKNRPLSPASHAHLEAQEHLSTLLADLNPLHCFKYNSALEVVINHYLVSKAKIDKDLNQRFTHDIVTEINNRFTDHPMSTATPSQPHPLEALVNLARTTPPITPAATPAPAVADPTQAQLFDPEKLQAFANKLSAAADQESQKIRHLIQNLQASGPLREFTQTPPAELLASNLQALEHRFPHFSEVISFVACHLRLQACGSARRNACFPPILLRAQPGVGKSRFARELAKALSLPFYNRDLSTTSEAFVITGHDPGWKGAKPGVIFDALANGQTLNPLLCFDELDKAVASTGHRSPANALYTLLEPHTAQEFADEYLPLPLNAKHVNWIFTANHEPIPEAILSRLEIFEIKNPTPAQLEAIAQSVWSDILLEDLPAGHPFAPQMDPSICKLMHAISPRIMRKVLTFACALAIEHNLSMPTQEHILQAASRYSPPANSRPIGFLTP